MAVTGYDHKEPWRGIVLLRSYALYRNAYWQVDTESGDNTQTSDADFLFPEVWAGLPN
jgi:hypothetical protein